MASNFRLDIPITESPLPAALDSLYDFVRDAGNAGVNDQVGVLGAIVEYDINKDARLYNDYVVRAFSDRTVRTSPLPSLGLGDTAERYSERYVDMLRLLVAALDTDLGAAEQEKIQLHEAAIKAINDDKRKWLRLLQDEWKKELAANGIDPTKIDTDPAVRVRYYELRVKFLKQNDYADTFQGYEKDLADRRMAIESIRLKAYPDDEARQLVNLYQQAQKYRTIRTRRPDLELKYGWDEYTIQNPEHASMPDIFDIGPLVESIVDPRTVLKGGDGKGQGYSVSTSTKVTNNHDKSWNVSGGGSWFPYISGEFSGSGETHFRSSFDRIREVSIHFDHVSRLDITRGGWFSKQVFGYKRVQEFLKREKMLAQSLSLLTTSLIVGRGLKLQLKFTDKSDVKEWGSTNRSGSGGISLFGVRLGGGGGGSSSWERRQIDEANQTVTFLDDASVCRLLGVIVSPVATMKLEEIALGARPLNTIPLLLEAAIAAAASGSVVDNGVIGSALSKP